jgi:hypothetical protein
VSKYILKWEQPLGKVAQQGESLLIHPYDFITLVHRKKGLDEACKVALKIIKDKYNVIFDKAKV